MVKKSDIDDLIKPTASEVRAIIEEQVAPLLLEIARLKSRIRKLESITSHAGASGFNQFTGFK